MAKRTALSRKRKAASKKAAITRKRRAAGNKAAVTRKRRVAGRKAGATKTLRAPGGVEAATAAFHQALRTNDLEIFMSYVAEDVFFMPPGESSVRGREALREWMTAFLAQYRTSSLALADREVLVGRGWAVELGTFEWALQPAAGGSAVVDSGNYMQVWKEQGDKTWKFAREVYNSSAPPSPVAAK